MIRWNKRGEKRQGAGEKINDNDEKETWDKEQPEEGREENKGKGL